MHQHFTLYVLGVYNFVKYTSIKSRTHLKTDQQNNTQRTQRRKIFLPSEFSNQRTLGNLTPVSLEVLQTSLLKVQALKAWFPTWVYGAGGTFSMWVLVQGRVLFIEGMPSGDCELCPLYLLVAGGLLLLLMCSYHGVWPHRKPNMFKLIDVGLKLLNSESKQTVPSYKLVISAIYHWDKNLTWEHGWFGKLASFNDDFF